MAHGKCLMPLVQGTWGGYINMSYHAQKHSTAHTESRDVVPDVNYGKAEQGCHSSVPFVF